MYLAGSSFSALMWMVGFTPVRGTPYKAIAICTMTKQYSIRVYLFSAFTGGILTYLTILVSVSVFAGFHSFLREYTWSEFYHDFISFLLVYRLSGSHTFFALIFGALAGIWGYVMSGASSSPRVSLFFYVLVSSFIFNLPKIISTSTIPQQFADRPAEVVRELLSLNIIFTVVYFVAYWLAIPTVYYLHKRYARYLQKFVEVR